MNTIFLFRKSKSKYRIHVYVFLVLRAYLHSCVRYIVYTVPLSYKVARTQSRVSTILMPISLSLCEFADLNGSKCVFACIVSMYESHFYIIT